MRVNAAVPRNGKATRARKRVTELSFRGDDSRSGLSCVAHLLESAPIGRLDLKGAVLDVKEPR
jgi:hypothetical protein